MAAFEDEDRGATFAWPAEDQLYVPSLTFGDVASMNGWHLLYEHMVRHGGKRRSQRDHKKTKQAVLEARTRRIVQYECGALALTGLCDDWGNCSECELRDKLQEVEEDSEWDQLRAEMDAARRQAQQRIEEEEETGGTQHGELCDPDADAARQQEELMRRAGSSRKLISKFYDSSKNDNLEKKEH